MPITQYVWAFDTYLAELDGSNNIQTVYTQDATHAGQTISSRAGGVSVYYALDAVGSTRVLTNAAGSITDTMIFEAWGGVVYRTGATSVALQWNGRWGYYNDGEISSYYVRRREYVPSLARWSSRDPLDALSALLSLYLYAANSPTMRSDPSGYDPGAPVGPRPMMQPGIARANGQCQVVKPGKAFSDNWNFNPIEAHRKYFHWPWGMSTCIQWKNRLSIATSGDMTVYGMNNGPSVLLFPYVDGTATASGESKGSVDVGLQYGFTVCGIFTIASCGVYVKASATVKLDGTTSLKNQGNQCLNTAIKTSADYSQELTVSFEAGARIQVGDIKWRGGIKFGTQDKAKVYLKGSCSWNKKVQYE